MKSNLLWISALTLMLPLTTCGQYSIDWFTIDGGGGTSTGGLYSVSGSIGQPDAGLMSGGNYSLAGGFWAITAIQMPGGPLLKIFLTRTNTAVISWPSASAGFTLQQNGNASASGWVAAPNAVTDDGTNKFISVSPPAGHRFYRLFKP